MRSPVAFGCTFRTALLPFAVGIVLLSGCGSGSKAPISVGPVGPTPPQNANEWTWVAGSSTRAGIPSAVYGTQGVAATGNNPGGRDGSAIWTDSKGDFWLFGGGRVDPMFTRGARNDLWMYNPSTTEWTWVSGSDTVGPNQIGIYGTEGVASAANLPGGRTGAVSWVDAQNNLWMFGGSGADSAGSDGYLNDLWEFSPTTSQWTWIAGTNTINGQAVYGNMGVANSTNTPGARTNAVGWTDKSGNFWLFGGEGFAADGSLGSFNDLWEYDPQTHDWTWIGGSASADSPGVYGTQGIASPSNFPGARSLSVAVVDHSGNFWLFGGLGYGVSQGSSPVESDLNDLWVFNPADKEWIWVSGSSSTGLNAANCVSGVYGSQGSSTSANVPGGRNAGTGWIDSSGNFWLFGGLGCDSNGIQGSLNDLWEYNPVSKMWTWQKGSSTVGTAQGGTGGIAGTYGKMGAPAIANSPGGRSSAMAWTDTTGNFWLYGGSGVDSAGNYGLLNDLWSYQP